MFGLGVLEILVIALVALVVIGPEQLPQFLRSAGQWYAKLRRMSDELRRAFTAELDRSEAEERFQKLQERRKQAEDDRKKVMEASGGVARPLRPTTPDPEKKHVLTPEEDPEAPALRKDPTPKVEAPPQGISADEWQKLPDDTKDLLRRVAAQKGAP